MGKRLFLILIIFTALTKSVNANENTCTYHTEAITENGVVTKYVEKKICNETEYLGGNWSSTFFANDENAHYFYSVVLFVIELIL